MSYHIAIEDAIQTSEYQIVEFPSLDTRLVGKLYRPVGVCAPFPIVVMAHGFSATIDGMVGERYAEIFCDAGFAVLLYDHYSLGRSGGQPRYQINKWFQIRGYVDAVNYVAALPEIDSERIGIWGDSMSGAEAIVAAAFDKRLKAVVAQVPACGREAPPEDPDGQLFQSIAETIMRGDLLSIPTSTTRMMPVVSSDQIETPSQLTPLTAFEWFTEYGNKSGTNWVNYASRVNLNVDVPFHSGICAPHLDAALQMLIAYDDEMPGANSDIARMVYEAAPHPKECIDLDGGHFGLVYYPSKLFDYASQAQRDFLLKYL